MPPFRTRPMTWAEALDALMQVETLRRQAFAPSALTRGAPKWEPPVDVLETAHEVLILTAMPGVDPDRIDVAIEDGVLLISGRRTMPVELRDAVVHRLELPQGWFERRIALPAGRYAAVTRATVNNCLVIRLSKTA
ncbi:MAG TPA: Hsp20/alpha crystallin family protein [Caulobacterales bacterium]|nr:Hsp20/alpha crystallin family protein [Caulobacterales bacterium]